LVTLVRHQRRQAQARQGALAHRVRQANHQRPPVLILVLARARQAQAQAQAVQVQAVHLVVSAVVVCHRVVQARRHLANRQRPQARTRLQAPVQAHPACRVLACPRHPLALVAQVLVARPVVPVARQAVLAQAV